jgi:hypothetical protein
MIKQLPPAGGTTKLNKFTSAQEMPKKFVRAASNASFYVLGAIVRRYTPQ